MSKMMYPIMGFGEIVNTHDPREAALEVARGVVFHVRRSLELEYPGETIELPGLGVLPLLTGAQRTIHDLGSLGMFCLFTFSWPAEITCPPGSRALFSGATRRWKRGRQPLISLIDGEVEKLIEREQWSREALTIQRTPVEHHGFFFAYMASISDRER
jgi:hypothetical protein